MMFERKIIKFCYKLHHAAVSILMCPIRITNDINKQTIIIFSSIGTYYTQVRHFLTNYSHGMSDT